MNPNPEFLDPIYKDLSELAKTYKKEAEDGEKALADSRKALADMPARSYDKKAAKRALSKSIKKLVFAKEKARYYRITAERRRVEGRREYKIAFAKGLSWPDPKEFKYYNINKKLKSIDLNWQKRVPKLFKTNPNYKPGQTMLPEEGKEKPKEENKTK